MERTRTRGSRRKRDFVRPDAGPCIVGIGTAVPFRRYTQEQVVALFGESDPRVLRLFQNSHIHARFLYLPEPVDGRMPEETNRELNDKHLHGALEIGPRAIEEALLARGLAVADVDLLCCVSSTGLLVPSLTSHLVKKMGFRESVRRLDLVGMGCSAAVNGLQAASDHARSHPGATALLVCVEVCSAAYISDERMMTKVVNSLFGDGAAATVVHWQDADDGGNPLLVDFESHLVPEALQAMRYEIEDNRLCFHLERDIPYVIGLNVEKPVGRLLGRHGLRVSDVDHWIVHSGGRKVIDAIEYNLGLTDHDVRHTLSVLGNFGNVSSGSVLFSLKEFLTRREPQTGDIGIMIAMGPGTAIETALLAW